MLKSNEVRIGNDVLYMDTDTPEFVPIKIDKADIMLLCEAIQGYNYKGIPLTPELFEKNLGLVKVRGTSDEYKIGNLTFNLCLYEQGYKVNIYLGGEFLGYHTVFHTIQNLLYSLTGVELKVTW